MQVSRMEASIDHIAFLTLGMDRSGWLESRPFSQMTKAMIGSRGNQIDYTCYLIKLPGRLIRIPGVLLNTVEYMWGVVQMRR
jgi:hypothetical protein